MNRFQQAAVFSAMMMASQPLHSASLALSFTVLPTTVMKPASIQSEQAGAAVSSQLTKTARGALGMLLNFTSNSPNGFSIDVSHAMMGAEIGGSFLLPQVDLVSMENGETIDSTSLTKKGASLSFKGKRLGQQLKVSVQPPVRSDRAGKDVITLMVTAR